MKWFAAFLVASAESHSIYNVIINSFGTTESRLDKRTEDGGIATSLDTQNLGSLHFNEVTVVSAHNAHANSFAAGNNMVKQLATNQKFSVYHSLKNVGVRGLLLDIEYDDQHNDIRLVHGSVDFNRFSDVLEQEIAPFLDEDPGAIITIDLETRGDRSKLLGQLRQVFGRSTSFSKRIFRITDPMWKRHKDWPMIKELRKADQRVLLLVDSFELQSDELGIMWRNDIVIENHWEGIDECRNRYDRKYLNSWGQKTISGYQLEWSRLFTMNHFCCATGVESYERVRPEQPGGGDNGWGRLYPRVLQCTAANGLQMKPNIIAVDWAHIGDALEVAEYLTIGGKIGGIGKNYMCHTGLDCATGSCSSDHHCQCQLCDAVNMYCNGCNAGESCVSIGNDGINECTANISQVVVKSQSNLGSVLEKRYVYYCAAAIATLLVSMIS